MSANLSIFDGTTIIGKRPYFGGDSGVDEDEAYEAAVRGVWNVAINWGNPEIWTGLDKETAVSSVICLRASNVSEGSEDPNTDNIGGRLKFDGTFGLFSALFALAWLIC